MKKHNFHAKPVFDKNDIVFFFCNNSKKKLQLLHYIFINCLHDGFPQKIKFSTNFELFIDT